MNILKKPVSACSSSKLLIKSPHTNFEQYSTQAFTQNVIKKLSPYTIFEQYLEHLFN